MRSIHLVLFMTAVSCGAAQSPSEPASSGTCGNAIVDPGEECDLGAFNSSTGSCTTRCLKARCGDGFDGPDEQCDNGPANADASDACRLDCTLPRCGDAIVDVGEDCDDGPLNSAEPNACRPGCIAAGCGDNIIDDGEACDAGWYNSDAPDAACRSNCLPARCGDGIQDTGEACDAGPLNGNAADLCRLDCRLPICGDGIIDTGEECDNGPANADAPDTCRLDCTLPRCGDEIVDKAEVCDTGADSATCDRDCTAPRCGDGLWNTPAGEQCDQLVDITNGWCGPGCHVECNAGFADCDGRGDTGCEIAPATDPLNCGGCGHDCGGGTCQAGTCSALPIATLPPSQLGYALRFGDNLLVASSMSYTADMTAFLGSMLLVDPYVTELSPVVTLANVCPFLESWAVRDGDAYGIFMFPDSIQDYPAFGSVSLTTGELTQLGGAWAFTDVPFYSSFGPDAFYFATKAAGSDEVRAVTLASGSSTSVSALRPSPANSQPRLSPNAANSSAVFQVLISPIEVWRVAMPPAAPAPTKVYAQATGPSPTGIAVDENWLYLATQADGIVRISATCTGLPCASTQIAPPISAKRYNLSLVDGYLYWDEVTAGVDVKPIRRVSVADGAAPEDVVPDATGINTFVVQGGFIYWPEMPDEGDGQLWKLALPLTT